VVAWIPDAFRTNRKLSEMRTEIRKPAMRRDAMGIADAIERLIDADRLSESDREDAYHAVCLFQKDTADYALARAIVAGRLAQVRGLTAVRLVAELEEWARRSMELAPDFRRAYAKRMLGTLYVLAPSSMVKHGDSEEGLEMLEEIFEKYPNDLSNRLRVAEGYLALNDPDPANEHLCLCLAQKNGLRPSEQRLLGQLVEQAGGPEELDCDG
jgi:hypothetical protein